jgi:hypothetical protein
MNIFFRRFLPACLLLLALLQLWRPARNLGAATGPNEIGVRPPPVPARVQDLLRRACYDCHSNHTNYPWYAEVQPVRWWLDSHINDGKRHLNFSEFGSYPVTRAAKKAATIADEVEQHSMPLKSYTWVHAEARLSAAEIRLLADWADKLHDQLAPP